jgi:2-phosphosulfolactate phosphatase
VTFDQAGYDLRCEWGLAGLRAMSSDVVIIVDVLSFSTAVDIAVSNGAAVLPYPYKDDSAAEFAAESGAILASRRGNGYSLSPESLESLRKGAALVLPSPNGGALSFESRAATTFTACLRNCEAVAAQAADCGSSIAVIPAGELWADGSLRPAIEDLIGAGAVLSKLVGRKSPEAELAVAAFESIGGDYWRVLSECGSGKELIGRGFAKDVEIAAAYGSSSTVPLLRADRFINGFGEIG